MSLPHRVRDVMTREVITIRLDAEITEAVSLLVAHDISGLPVLDADGALVGILTERDCIRVALHAGYFDERGGRVAEYMSHPVETVDVDDGLVDLAERLCLTSHRRFPVLENGRLVGLVSRRDILTMLDSGAWFARPPDRQ